MHLQSGKMSRNHLVMEKGFLFLLSYPGVPHNLRILCGFPLRQGGLLGGLSSTTPSRSRHGSTIEALCEQTAGAMIHNILPRAIEQAFSDAPKTAAASTEHPVDEGEEEPDLRQLLRKRARKAYNYATSQRLIMLHAILSWVSKPIDDLWHYTCKEKDPLKIVDLVRSQGNPVIRCLSQLSGMLLLPLKDSSLMVVWENVMSDAKLQDEVWVLEQVSKKMISMVAQLNSRLLLPYQSWPYKLATLVDDEEQEAARKGRIKELLEQHSFAA